MTTYLTADPHFGHAKLLEPGQRPRPFASVEEMNRTLVENWNKVVTSDDRDVVWVLGDFALGLTEQEMNEIFAQLRGRKRLVIGNHDVDNRGVVKAALLRLPWDRIATHRAEIKHGRQRIVLDHFAGLTWNADHYGSYLAYGHSHGNLPGLPGSVDVGMDAQNFRPISVEEFVRQADDSICDWEARIDLVVRNLQGRADRYRGKEAEILAERPPKKGGF